MFSRAFRVTTFGALVLSVSVFVPELCGTVQCYKQISVEETCHNNCSTSCPPLWGDANGAPGVVYEESAFVCQPCVNYGIVSEGPCSSSPPGYVSHCNQNNGVCCFRMTTDTGTMNTILPCRIIPKGSALTNCNNNPPGQ